METQDISQNLGNGDILIYQSEDENQTKIQLFGISEQPQKELMPDVLTWSELMGGGNKVAIN